MTRSNTGNKKTPSRPHSSASSTVSSTPSRVQSFDTHHSAASRSTRTPRKEFNYESYRAKRGPVSVFASIAELTAHLRSCEVKKEAQRRRHQNRQRERNQQAHMQSNPIAPLPSNELYVRPINSVQSPTEMDMVLLGLPYANGQEEIPFKSESYSDSRQDLEQTANLKPKDKNGKHNVSVEVELRDDQSTVPYMDHIIVTEQTGNQLQGVGITRSEYYVSPDQTKNETTNETTKTTKSTAKNLFSVSKPFRMIKKVLKKVVKKIYSCKPSIFKQEEKIILKKAKGNLC